MFSNESPLRKRSTFSRSQMDPSMGFDEQRDPDQLIEIGPAMQPRARTSTTPSSFIPLTQNRVTSSTSTSRNSSSTPLDLTGVHGPPRSSGGIAPDAPAPSERHITFGAEAPRPRQVNNLISQWTNPFSTAPTRRPSHAPVPFVNDRNSSIPEPNSATGLSSSSSAASLAWGPAFIANPFASTNGFSKLASTGQSTPIDGAFPSSNASTFNDTHTPSYKGSPNNMPGTPRSGLREAMNPPAARPLMLRNNPSMTKKQKRTRSTMLAEGAVLDKPWLDPDVKDPYARIAWWVTLCAMLIGVVLSAVQCYFAYSHVRLIKEKYLCMVLDENFEGTDESVFGVGGNWFRDVELGGFSTGEFSMATSSANNSFIRDGRLHIVPTLTSDQIGTTLQDGFTFNLTDCTYNVTQIQPTTEERYFKNCGAVYNSSLGQIIPPVQSAKISTRRSASIRYGKVEIMAKLPTGDWIWPSVTLFPVEETYGEGTMSGQIDMLAARGNNRSYPAQGYNYVRGALEWGPLPWINSVAKTYGWWTTRRGGYNEDFHKYGIEWTEDWMKIYVDTRLRPLLDITFKKTFFERGEYPQVVTNDTGIFALENPWVKGTKSAPFDQNFYLALHVAVGSTNGWFPDNVGGKPWLDESPTAVREFARSQDTWYPTWPQDLAERAMIVDYVRMWQKC